MKSAFSIITSRKIESFFLFYIILQPILDLLSYFGLSISLPIRGLVMVVGFYYLLKFPNKKIRKASIIYLVVLGAFLAINLVNNLIIKSPFFLFNEFSYSIKIAYVIEMIIVYSAVFISINSYIDWKYIVQRNITWNMFAIGVVMLIATLMGTGKLSYLNPNKLGHSGWFFSANELSAILAMGFGILILFVVGKSNVKLKLYLLPIGILTLWSMLTIGTKVGLFSAIIILIISLAVSLIYSLVKKENWHNLLLIFIFFVFLIAIVPHTPVGKNLNIDYTIIEKPLDRGNTEEKKPDQNQDNNVESEQDKENVSKITKNVLSGREDFFSMHVSMFKEAPISQKLLGMGPGGNYDKKLKLIEMDFLDWFFAYGFVGFIIFALPLIYMGASIVNIAFKSRLRLFTPEFFMITSSVVLGLGIAFVAGHILLNPASGFYLSILIAYLYVMSMEHNMKLLRK